jgi:hypothetical protein
LSFPQFMMRARATSSDSTITNPPARKRMVPRIWGKLENQIQISNSYFEEDGAEDLGEIKWENQIEISNS